MSWSNGASLIADGGLYNILELPYVKPFSEYYISEVNEMMVVNEQSVSIMQMIMNNRIMPEMAYYYQYDDNALLLKSMNQIDSSGEIVSFLTKTQTRAEKLAQKFYEKNFQ